MNFKKKLSAVLLPFLAVAALASCEKSDEITVTEITLSPDKVEIVEGETKTIKATVSPAGAEDKMLTWTSSDQDVASVDDKGVVTAVKIGSATITASADGKSGSCAVTVVAKTINVSGVTLSETSLNLNVGDTKTLTATVDPDNATNKNVSWKSDKESVATVDQAGNVTAVGSGSAKVIVTTEDGGLTATCVVTVTQKEAVIYAIGQEAATTMRQSGRTARDSCFQTEATTLSATGSMLTARRSTSLAARRPETLLMTVTTNLTIRMSA